MARAASAAARRMPSAASCPGLSWSSGPNSVGSYTAMARTRPGYASAAINATAAPYEWPTSENGAPAASNTGASTATSSASVRVRSSGVFGQAGLRPAPSESGAKTQ